MNGEWRGKRRCEYEWMVWMEGKVSCKEKKMLGCLVKMEKKEGEKGSTEEM